MKRLISLLALAGLLAVQARAQSPTPPGGPGRPSGPAPAAADTARGERVDGIAAVVGGEPIFESEVDEQLYLFLMQSGARPDSTTAAGMRRELLDRLIDEKLIVQEARRKQVAVADAELDKQVDQAIADAKERLGGEEAYRQELRREGISEGDLRDRYRNEIRRQMLANQLLRKELNLKLEVSPSEAEAFFRANPKEFPTRPAEVRVALVQIPIEPEAGAKAAARKRAEDVLARIRKGEPFSRVAQEVSEDPATRNSGGDLGWFGRGTVDSTFERTVFAMQPGQTSGVIETGFGLHIVRVEEADTARGGEVHARHILIRVPLTEADERRAAATAQKVHEEAAKGMDFAALVRRYSQYRGPQDPSGDLGFLPMTAFSPEFQAAIDSLTTGELTPPLRNAQGFHVFKILDRRPERAYELAEVKPRLPELVRQIKLRKQYETWVASLRSRARVEIR